MRYSTHIRTNRDFKFDLYLKLDASEVKNLPKNAKNVRNIGHYGTGDFELTIRTPEEAEASRVFIKDSFDRVI